MRTAEDYHRENICLLILLTSCGRESHEGAETRRGNNGLGLINCMPDTCLFAHYDRFDQLAEHVVYYLDAIRRAGFAVTVISTARLGAAERYRLASVGADLILRENSGLDFGSWAAGLAGLRDSDGQLRIDGRLLLANDSVYGPIGNLSETMERLFALPGDVHGMVESGEIAPHLQSWFLIFSPVAYRNPAFETTFAQNFAAMSKDEIIRNGEISLSANLRAAGLRTAALGSDPPRGGINRLLRSNPAHFLWRSVIEQDGVPFIKVELLRDNPARVPGLEEWQSVVLARAPHLLQLIKKHLSDRQSEQAVNPTRARAISYGGFIVRDDTWARARQRLPMYINLYIWHTLNAALRARGAVLGRFRRSDR